MQRSSSFHWKQLDVTFHLFFKVFLLFKTRVIQSSVLQLPVYKMYEDAMHNWCTATFNLNFRVKMVHIYCSSCICVLGPHTLNHKGYVGILPWCEGWVRKCAVPLKTQNGQASSSLLLMNRFNTKTHSVKWLERIFYFTILHLWRLPNLGFNMILVSNLNTCSVQINTVF